MLVVMKRNEGNNEPPPILKDLLNEFHDVILEETPGDTIWTTSFEKHTTLH